MRDKDKDYNMVNRYLEAAEAHYTAEQLEAEAVLSTYFNNPVGIGEHSDLPEEVYKWVDKLASARDGLAALRFYQKRNAEPSMYNVSGEIVEK